MRTLLNPKSRELLSVNLPAEGRELNVEISMQKRYESARKPTCRLAGLTFTFLTILNQAGS